MLIDKKTEWDVFIHEAIQFWDNPEMKIKMFHHSSAISQFDLQRHLWIVNSTKII